MSYYNRAALMGGMSMADALAQLGGTEGGWRLPSKTVIEGFMNDPAKWDGLRQATTQFNAVSRFVIPPKELERALAAAFGYDSLLAQGEPGLARSLKQQYCDNPAHKTVFNYVRRKMHAGTSKPQRMTKAQRDALRTAALERRLAAQERLGAPDFGWFGSNQYSGVGSRLTGNYKGLWFTPKGATGTRGVANIEGVERQIPSYVVPEDVKAEMV